MRQTLPHVGFQRQRGRDRLVLAAHGTQSIEIEFTILLGTSNLSSSAFFVCSVSLTFSEPVLARRPSSTDD